MEYDGLFVKYPIDRALEDEERLRHVEQRVATSSAPTDKGSVICQGPTVLEMVDKYYAWRGFGQIFSLPLVIAMTWFLADTVTALVTELNGPTQNDSVQAIAALLFGTIAYVAVLAMSGWLVFGEAFTLTHYPIRFDRKNRMVYVFRPTRRSEVLRIRWDDVYWHVRHNKNKMFGVYNWFVAGHVMDKDRKTVRETFSFGHVGNTPEEVYPQWEYVRRFMEIGPDAIPPASYFLPIAKRREGFWWGAQTLLLLAPHRGLLGTVGMLPLLAPAVFTRWLCMLSNRVPAWPADIEAACRSASEDERTLPTQGGTNYAKIIALLAAGILFDVALLAWLYSLLPMAM